jgi:hypothetical protein
MDEDIFDVARTIRPYLPKLVGTEAHAYDQEIAHLIAKAQDGYDVDDQMLAVLTRSPAVRDWSARVLENDRHLPPNIQQAERGFQPLPGLGEPVEAERYECPCGDYVWYKISVSDSVPQCPTHKCALVSS